ncbi:MAG: hypothetical protein KFW07_03735, partial [Mycoplasmataceae bacterium]|nr:hypothetical protein [Mycoplasmataceae bacterium]
MKKQNKTLLGLGIATLAILPFAALVSCGNTQSISLESQMDKYQNGIAKPNNEWAVDVAKRINEEKDPAKKIKIIGDYITLPILEDGFSLEIINVTTGGNKNLDLVINIRITKVSDGINQSKTIIITGFKSALTKINISPKTNRLSQVDFKNLVDEYKKATAQVKKIQELSRIFNNVNSENFAHFDVEISADESKFILTAKDGFIFGETVGPVKPTIESEPYLPTVATDLKISSKAEVTESDFIKAKTDFEKVGATSQEKVDALNLLFTGVTLDNLAHFVVDAGEKIENIFTLDAIEGYYFDNPNNKTLISGTIIPDPLKELKIAAQTTVTTSEFNQAKADYEKVGATPQGKVDALNLLFTGVTLDNLAHFVVDAGEKIFTLTAKDGYTFGKAAETLIDTLKSKEPTPDPLKQLGISAQTTVTTIGFNQAKADYEKVEATPQEKVDALNLLFTGVTLDNLAHFGVFPGEKIFTLTAKDGYTFDKTAETLIKTLESKEPTSDPLVQLGISANTTELKIGQY